MTDTPAVQQPRTRRPARLRYADVDVTRLEEIRDRIAEIRAEEQQLLEERDALIIEKAQQGGRPLVIREAAGIIHQRYSQILQQAGLDQRSIKAALRASTGDDGTPPAATTEDPDEWDDLLAFPPA